MKDMDKKKNKKTTIKDVASLAGVSISSVSRYLSNPQSIQPLAAYNIRNAIRELKYEPNKFAQNLRKGSSNVVGLIVPHMEYFFGQICRVVSDYFFERGYVVFVCESDSEGEKEKFYIQELLKLGANGIIIAPSGQNTAYLHALKRDYKNLIMIDRLEEVGCDIVLENHRVNAQSLTAWMLAHKPCDHVLLLYGWPDSYNTRMCFEGSGEALRVADVTEERVLRVFTARKREVVLEGLHKLLGRCGVGERPLVLAFGSDILEYVVMSLHQRYPDWADRMDLGGFAIAGTAEKLGIQCSLVIKNPEEVAITAAKLLNRMFEEGDKDVKEGKEQVHWVEVMYKFI